MLKLSIIVTNPEALSLDLTDRLDHGALGDITESSEEQLLALTHGDMTVSVNDPDRAVERFLAPATPTRSYEVAVDRETGLRRPKWERIFAGVLDLPWSISYDRKAKKANLQIFSYTKLLENASAHDIKRIVIGRTASVDSGSDVVAVSDTTDILRGDKIEIADGTNRESQRVIAVISGTQLRTEASWTHLFTDAELTLLTPYLRNKTVKYLAELVFAAAGIPNPIIETSDEIASYPIATELNIDGLPPLPAVPRSIVQALGYLSATYILSVTTTRKRAVDVVSGFTDGATSNETEFDWTPYMDTEPGTIRTFSGAADIGIVAFNHATGDRYDLEITVVPSGPNTQTTLRLRRNGLSLVVVDSYTHPDAAGYEVSALDHEPSQNQVWISWKKDEFGVLRQGLAYYDVGSSTLFPIAGAKGGTLRTIAQLGAVLHAGADGQVALWDAEAHTIRVAVTGQPTVSGALAFQYPGTACYGWSARLFAGTIIMLYRTLTGTTRLRVYEPSSLGQLADYEISSASAPGQPVVCLFADPSVGERVAVGYAGGRYFVLSKRFAGVIPYADFEGLSCAAALRELATCSLTIILMDYYKHGMLRSRNLLTARREPIPLDTPIEQVSRPLWEFWRRSVEVVGRTEDDAEIVEFAGDPGDSAHRLSIDSRLITTHSLAQAVAALYASFLSTERAQEDIAVEDLRELPQFLHLVTLEGVLHFILESQRNVKDRTARLRLASYYRPSSGGGATSPAPATPACTEGPEITVNGNINSWITGGVGNNLILNGDFSSWDSGTDDGQGMPSSWTPQAVWPLKATDNYSPSYSIQIRGDGASAGWIESRPSTSTVTLGQRGTLYFQLTTGETYEMRLRLKNLGSAGTVPWSVALHNAATDWFATYGLHRQTTPEITNDPGVFVSGGVPLTTNMPKFSATLSWLEFVAPFTVAGTGLSGSYWAAVWINKSGGASGSVATLADDVSVKLVSLVAQYWNISLAEQASGATGYAIGLINPGAEAWYGHAVGTKDDTSNWPVIATNQMAKNTEHHLRFKVKVTGAAASANLTLRLVALNAAQYQAGQPAIPGTCNTQGSTVREFDIGANWDAGPGNITVQNIANEGIWREYYIKLRTQVPASITADPFYWALKFSRGSEDASIYIDDVSMKACT